MQSGGPLPAGGIKLTVRYCTGTKSSHHHLPLLNPVLQPVFGRPLYRGSLNLHGAGPVSFPAPATAQLAGEEWLFAPVILSDSLVGVAARKADSGDIPFIEVFAPDQLVPKLHLKPGATLEVRVLPGEFLALAA